MVTTTARNGYPVLESVLSGCLLISFVLSAFAVIQYAATGHADRFILGTALLFGASAVTAARHLRKV